MLRRVLSVGALALLPLSALAQLSPAAQWATEAETHYNYAPNTTYISENGVQLRLDMYSRRDVTTPQPTLIFFHGGFWVAGSKDSQTLGILPWLEKGWNVAVVGYRLGGVAPAPAAVVDAFCALRWLGTNAAMYNIDPAKIVASGQSAGGHLALTLGMLNEAGFDASCPEGTTPRVAAVINWFGVTDVVDVISGPNRNETPASWFGGMNEEEAVALAKRLSPMQYVRDGLPPILSIQGDADNVVPYNHGVMLHEALAKTNTPNQFLTIPGGGHGRFTAGERATIYETINAFLKQHDIE
ncbi:MAG: alpha/beta hydrolase fold domain-containing protein [Gammaproteobacteria bacterium]